MVHLKKYLVLSVLFTGCFLYQSCQSPDEKMEDYILGNWRMSFVRVTMPTYEGGKNEKVQDIDFDNPKDARNMDKMYYVFKRNEKGDKTFKNWSQGSLGKQAGLSGDWEVKEGVLIWKVVNAIGKTLEFKFAIEKTVHGFSIENHQDRDRDGEEDDTYYVEVKRLKDDFFKD